MGVIFTSFSALLPQSFPNQRDQNNFQDFCESAKTDVRLCSRRERRGLPLGGSWGSSGQMSPQP